MTDLAELVKKRYVVTAKTLKGQKAIKKEVNSKLTKQQQKVSRIFDRIVLNTSPLTIEYGFNKDMRRLAKYKLVAPAFSGINQKRMKQLIIDTMKKNGADVSVDYTITVKEFVR